MTVGTTALLHASLSLHPGVVVPHPWRAAHVVDQPWSRQSLDHRQEQPVLDLLLGRQLLVGHKARVQLALGVFDGAVRPAAGGLLSQPAVVRGAGRCVGVLLCVTDAVDGTDALPVGS